jgi:hypothetical protein
VIWRVLGDHRVVTVADDQLARIGSVFGECDHQDAALLPVDRLRDPAEVTDTLFEALQQIIAIAVKLGVGPTPGSDREEDAVWATSVALARRDVLANQSAGIDHGLAGGNLRLPERIDAMIASHDDHEWQQLVRQRVTERIDAVSKGANAALSSGDSAKATRSLNAGSRCRSGGGCVIRLTIGCVRRPRRSLTRRVEA